LKGKQNTFCAGLSRGWTFSFLRLCVCVRVANKNKYIILHDTKTRARRCTNLIQIQLKKWQNNVRAGRAAKGVWILGWVSPPNANPFSSSCGRSVTTIKRQEKGDAGTGRPFVVATSPESPENCLPSGITHSYMRSNDCRLKPIRVAGCKIH